MAQIGYDIVAHDGGWAIVMTPGRSPAFPTKQHAFDTAAEVARKLRFVGYEVRVRPERDDARGRNGEDAPANAPPASRARIGRA